MQGPDTRSQATDDSEIAIGDLIALLWAGRRLVAGVSFSALVAAVAYLALTPPTYEADALLQIEGSNSGILALPSSMTSLFAEDSSSLAEMEIVKSRQVLGAAVADLNLDWIAQPVLAPLIGQALVRFDLPLPQTGILAPYARKDEKVTLSYLEVPPHWLGEEMLLEKTGSDDFALTLPDGTRLEGRVGALLADRSRGVAIQPARLDGPPGRQFRIVQQSELAAIATLASGLRISERGRQTGIIDVRLRGPDRTAIAERLNAVVRAYVEQNISKSAAEARKSLSFVESQLPLAEVAVQEAEQKLNDFRSANMSVDLEFETTSLLSEATDVERKLRELALKEEEIKDRYTQNHPVYRQLLDERAALTGRLEEVKGGISVLPETQREVVNMTRDLEVAQATYLELLNRAQELRVLSASQIGSVRIVDAAATQITPVAPRTASVLGLSLLMGLAAGVAAVVLRNSLRRGIGSATEIERLGLPVFATVNIYGGKAKATGGRAPLIARDDPDDIVVEALRSLRTSLHFGMLDATSRSIVVTSSAPGAGKSFISANLAHVASQAGQRVCLIDADMRRGTQHRYFDLPRKRAGLADYLSEKGDLDSVLCDSGSENLSVILTGGFPPNPSELLMRNRLSELITELDSRFDLVIFDAPPLLAVTDAAIIGRNAGMVIGVVRHMVTPPGELEAMSRALSNLGSPMRGTVLNSFDPRRAKGSVGRYGYGYGYGYANRYAYKRSQTKD